MKRSTVVFYSSEPAQTTLYEHPQLPLVDTYQGSSFSVVMSLASYLCWKFPSLAAPGHKEPFEVKFHDKNFPNLHSVLHPMYPVWCSTFVRSIDHDDAVREADDCYFAVKVSQEYAAKLHKLGFHGKKVQGAMNWDHVKPGLSKNIKPERQLVLFISCSMPTTSRPKIDLSALYCGMYFNNQRWRGYHIFENGQPSDQQYQQASLIVIPGSSLSVLSGNKQIEDLIKKLQQVIKQNTNLRILGVCFGCQLVAPVFGGKVDKADVGTFGLNHIKVDQAAINKLPLPFLAPLKSQTDLCVSQFHSDQVSVLPKDFVGIASSSTCKVEIMVKLDGRCLAIQCHPEYSAGFIQSYGLRMEHHSREITEKDIQSKAVEKLEKYDEGGRILRDVVRQFIKASPLRKLQQPHL